MELPSGETKPVALLSDKDLNWLKSEREHTAPVRERSDHSFATLDSRVDVNLLIATDNEMYNRYSNWKKRAQSVLDDANMAYGSNDVKIRLVPIFDDSKRVQLSQNFNANNPISVFMNTFGSSYLNSKSADIAIYLSGTNFTQYVGGAYGYDDGNITKRRFAVMTYEAWPPGYIANPQDRANVFTHEIGHMFDADHEDAVRQGESYNRAWTYPLNGVTKKTVMYHILSQDPTIFSSNDGIHGDISHDNARRLRETKGEVSGYAS